MGARICSFCLARVNDASWRGRLPRTIQVAEGPRTANHRMVDSLVRQLVSARSDHDRCRLLQASVTRQHLVEDTLRLVATIDSDHYRLAALRIVAPPAVAFAVETVGRLAVALSQDYYRLCFVARCADAGSGRDVSLDGVVRLLGAFSVDYYRVECVKKVSRRVDPSGATGPVLCSLLRRLSDGHYRDQALGWACEAWGLRERLSWHDLDSIAAELNRQPGEQHLRALLKCAPVDSSGMPAATALNFLKQLAASQDVDRVGAWLRPWWRASAHPPLHLLVAATLEPDLLEQLVGMLLRGKGGDDSGRRPLLPSTVEFGTVRRFLSLFAPDRRAGMADAVSAICAPGDVDAALGVCAAEDARARRMSSAAHRMLDATPLPWVLAELVAEYAKDERFLVVGGGVCVHLESPDPAVRFADVRLGTEELRASVGDAAVHVSAGRRQQSGTSISAEFGETTLAVPGLQLTVGPFSGRVLHLGGRENRGFAVVDRRWQLSVWKGASLDSKPVASGGGAMNVTCRGGVFIG